MLFGKEHVDRYRETDGAEGHDWRNGTKILLLTTTGRKSGEERTTPLIYAPYGDDAYTIIASKGGSDEPPAWYLNLDARRSRRSGRRWSPSGPTTTPTRSRRSGRSRP